MSFHYLAQRNYPSLKTSLKCSKNTDIDLNILKKYIYMKDVHLSETEEEIDKGYLQLFFNHATIFCVMKYIIICKKFRIVYLICYSMWSVTP